jgi:hypothetical protein
VVLVKTSIVSSLTHLTIIAIIEKSVAEKSNAIATAVPADIDAVIGGVLVVIYGYSL